jgi:hypothetical protein
MGYRLQLLLSLLPLHLDLLLPLLSLPLLVGHGRIDEATYVYKPFYAWNYDRMAGECLAHYIVVDFIRAAFRASGIPERLRLGWSPHVIAV